MYSVELELSMLTRLAKIARETLQEYLSVFDGIDFMTVWADDPNPDDENGLDNQSVADEILEPQLPGPSDTGRSPSGDEHLPSSEDIANVGDDFANP